MNNNYIGLENNKIEGVVKFGLMTTLQILTYYMLKFTTCIGISKVKLSSNYTAYLKDIMKQWLSH